MPKPSLNASYRTSRRWGEREAHAAVTALAESGLGVALFAEQEGLDAQRLYVWRRRLGGASPTAAARAAFVEVRPLGRERVEVVLRSGVVLRVTDSVDVAALARIVEALESVQARTC